MPASAGPMNRARLKMTELIASAEASDSRSTRVGIKARREGCATPLAIPSISTRANRISIVIASLTNQDRQQACLGTADQLSDANCPDPVAAVGEHAGKRCEKQDRQEIGERNQSEPGAGMGQGPGQPTDRDPLKPPADQRDAVAADVNKVVAMRKGAGDVA